MRNLKSIVRYLFVFVFLSTVSISFSYSAEQNWDEAIERVRKLEQDMKLKADAKGYDQFVGSSEREIDVDKHTCSILGRMLGRYAVVKHLEEPLPNQSRSGSGAEFRLAQQSLSNWISTATWLRKLDYEHKVRIWNLDCAGKMEISLSASLPEKVDLGTFFEIEANGEVLRILGDVEEGFTSRLKDALEKHPRVTTVALGSRGGLVREAILSGYEIRRRKLNTMLWNSCMSACPLVFLGGIERIAFTGREDLGLHKLSSYGKSLPDESELYSLVRSYAFEMGADGNKVVEFMLSAEPDDIKFVDLNSLCETSIATEIKPWCF